EDAVLVPGQGAEFFTKNGKQLWAPLDVISTAGGTLTVDQEWLNSVGYDNTLPPPPQPKVTSSDQASSDGGWMGILAGVAGLGLGGAALGGMGGGSSSSDQAGNTDEPLTPNFTSIVSENGEVVTEITDLGSLPIQIQVNENVSAGTSAFQIHAEDGNTGATISFNLTGKDASQFIINKTTGNVTFKNAPDYESQQQYQLFVLATDNTDRSTIQEVLVNINDLDEAGNEAPQVTFENIQIIEETNEIGTLIFEATVNDVDENESFFYQISGPAEDSFAIDAHGNITNLVALDYETKSEHVIKVTVIDSGGLSASQDVAIVVKNTSVGDMINNAPQFLSDNKTFIAEGISNIVLFKPDVHDPDPEASLSYSISGKDAAFLEIDTDTGFVYLKDKEAADFETKRLYEYVVEVTDGIIAEPVGHSMLTEVIDGNDINQNDQPEFASESTYNILGSPSLGQVIYRAGIYDADSNDSHTFALTANPGAPLSIDTKTGAVSINSAELGDEEIGFNFRVSVTDSAGATDSQNVAVNFSGTSTYSVGVAKGIPSDVQVFFDTNGDLTHTPGIDSELGVADADGNFALRIKNLDNGVLVMRASNISEDLITNIDISGLVLTAPVGANVISPLTTLLNDMDESNLLLQKLGLSPDINLTNYHPYSDMTAEAVLDPEHGLAFEKLSYQIFNIISLLQDYGDAAELLPEKSETSFLNLLGQAILQNEQEVVDLSDVDTLNQLVQEVQSIPQIQQSNVADDLLNLSLEMGAVAVAQLNSKIADAADETAYLDVITGILPEYNAEINESLTLRNPTIEINTFAGKGYFTASKTTPHALDGSPQDDLFELRDTLDVTDVVTGGIGLDELRYTDTNNDVNELDNVTGIERVVFGNANTVLVTRDVLVPDGGSIVFDATNILAPNALNLDSRAETNGFVTVRAGTGDDVITTGQRDDIIDMGESLSAADTIDGQAGVDRLLFTDNNNAIDDLNGVKNVEYVVLGSATTRITSSDEVVAANETLHIDATNILADQFLVFDGGAELDGQFHITASQGNDQLTGGQGDDAFIMDIHLTRLDLIDGQTGTDSLAFTDSGEATSDLDNVRNVENITLGNATTEVVARDSLISEGATVKIDATSIDVTNSLTFDGRAETDGAYIFTLGESSLDVSTGRGDDKFILESILDSADSIDGGDGTDSIQFTDGNGADDDLNNVKNIEKIILGDAVTSIVATDDLLSSGGQLELDASALTIAHGLNYDASAETDGHYLVTAGLGNDRLVLGAGDDIINMSSHLTQADEIDGGAGEDRLILKDNDENNDYLDSVRNIEIIELENSATTIATIDALVAENAQIFFDASKLTSENNLNLNASEESDGHYQVHAGLGNDIIQLGTGNDIVNFGQGLNSLDEVSGGLGEDQLIYRDSNEASDELNNVKGFEKIILVDAITNIETIDDLILANETLTIDAGALSSQSNLTLVATAEADGHYIVSTGSGNDRLVMGAGNDIINMSTHLTKSDIIDGGTGSDTLTFTDSNNAADDLDQVTNIETITLSDATTNLTIKDSLVANGASLTLDASNLTSTNSLTFDASAELDGNFVLTGGAGNDQVTMGQGTDRVSLGIGDDYVHFGAYLTTADITDGGAGSDTLTFTDNGLGTDELDNVRNFEFITLGDANTSIVAVDELIISEGNITLDARNLSAAHSLNFDASAETDGDYFVSTGAGDDSLILGGGDDVISMSTHLTRDDQIDGGAGQNTLTFTDNGGGTDELDQVTNIANIIFGNAATDLVIKDSLIADDAWLNLDARSITSGFRLDASAETNGNIIFGGSSSSDIIIAGKGNYQALLSSGNDEIHMSNHLTADDYIDGGQDGVDILTFADNGEGTDELANVRHFETIILENANTDIILTNNELVVAGKTIRIDASALDQTHSLSMNLASETDGYFDITGGQGDDEFIMDARLSSADHVDGGDGIDTLSYSDLDVDDLTELNNISNIEIIRPNDFTTKIIAPDRLLDDTSTLTIDGSLITQPNFLDFDATAEIAGNYIIEGSTGDDILKTGGGNDNINGNDGDDLIHTGTGIDVVTAGSGDDSINFGTDLTLDDRVDGGTGTDTLIFQGNLNSTSALDQVTNVEVITLLASSTTLVLKDTVVQTGANLSIDASSFEFGQLITLDATGETDGHISLTSGLGNDIISAGGGNDSFETGGGNDQIAMGNNLTSEDLIDGGTGNDTLTFTDSNNAADDLD
ncbi:MAG: hypothetical protein EBT20_12005, partial [Alphaproteobacteria bacterium]|nr:hypothetical protein [Alphaproteobacteria bacterium]